MKIFNTFRRFDAWLDRQNNVLQFVIMLSIIFIVRTFIFGLYAVPTGSMEPTMLVGESFLSDKLTPWFKSIERGEIVSFNEPQFPYSDNYFMNLFQRYVWGPSNWTKRVIGIPGDHLKGVIEHGIPVIYLNGQVLEEPYVNPHPIVQVRETAYQLTFPNINELFTRGIYVLFNTQTNFRLRTYDEKYDVCAPEQPYYKINASDIMPDARCPLIFYPKTPSTGGVTDIFEVTLDENEYFVMGDNRKGSYDSRGFGKLDGKLIHGRILCCIFSFDTPNSLLYELITGPIEFLKKARSWKRWFRILR